jgi:ribosome biogenesis protein Tsr3
LLSIFVWGHTFFELNHAMLESYAAAHDSAEIIRLQGDLYRDASVC